MTRIVVQFANAVAATAILCSSVSLGRADVIASNSLATVYLDAAPSPASGFITYTFSVQAASMMEVGTIDADFSAAMMRQVGVGTVFQDLNSFFPSIGEDPASDSQFEFSFFGDDLLVASSGESATMLAADFTGFTPITAVRPIAHVVLPIGVNGIANLSFAVRPIGQVEGQAATFNNVAFGAAAIPEASSFVLGGVLLVGVLLRGSYVSSRRRSAMSTSAA